MARPLRIEFPGAFYHVTSRGNARGAIFLDDVDHEEFLWRLGGVVREHRWLCHAYCLMTNHFHLLLETPEANLSRGMRRLNGAWSQHFNRRHERVGHLLQGRFHAVLVERDSHLLELARYVVLNPVRGGMVTTPEDYRWSSLRATLGLAPAPAWLDSRALLARFGSRARYLDFVHEGIGQISPWAAVRGGILGSDDFVAQLGETLDRAAAATEFSRDERLVGRDPLEAHFPPALAGARAARNDTIRALVHAGHYTAAEISRHLGLHYSTVSRIVAAGAGRAPAG
jgi:REP element-mobilizing transposase RayT